LLFPVTIYYFSPYLIIKGALQGIIVGSFLMFGLLFVLSLFLGRAFCGWACPAAGLQEACFMIKDRRAKGGKCDSLKYVIWVPWAFGIVVAALKAGSLRTIDPLYQTRNGLSVVDSSGYIVFYSIVGLILILSLTAGRRAFCHCVCWMAPFMVIGRGVRNSLGWPSLRLLSDKSKCVNCLTCTSSCPMSLDVNAMVQLEEMENTECILCGTCIDVCPQSVLRYSFSRQKKPARSL
jgi:ferredoxin-type protein NapH